MNLTKKVLACAGTALMVLSMTACAGKPAASGETGTGADGVKELTFPTYMAGENVGAKFFLPQVERFNQKYEGEYRMLIEEVPQAAYADKIKQLSQQNKLPALLHAPGSGGIDIQWFRTVAVANDMAYDLSALFQRYPETKNVVIEESLEFCTTDGKVVCLPESVLRPSGVFYNSTQYTPDKPIRDMSIDEFVSTLGDNKIAFQTADNGWTTGILLTALIADENGGKDLLQDNFADKLFDYNHPAIINAVEKLQVLMQTNAASNSIGAAYADAANAFMSENAAIICNGPWMSGEFVPESADKWSNNFDGANVRADLLPGNIGVVNASTYGPFWVSGQASEAEIEVALAFLAFRLSPEEQESFMLAEGGSAPNIQTSETFASELAKTPVLADLDEATTADTQFVPNILEVFPSSIADVEFGKLLPKLADQSITAEEFCAQLTEKAQVIQS